MFRRRNHPLWRLDDSSLEGLTPVRARDLIVTCFFQAQKEAYAEAKGDLGLSRDDQSVMESVETSIRMAFRQVGGDWDHPTRDELCQLIDLLARKSATFGTPEEIVRHHRGQIQRVLDRLPG
jgi:hypothetical protein